MASTTKRRLSASLICAIAVLLHVEITRAIDFNIGSSSLSSSSSFEYPSSQYQDSSDPSSQPEVMQLLKKTGHAFRKVGDILLEKCPSSTPSETSPSGPGIPYPPMLPPMPPPPHGYPYGYYPNPHYPYPYYPPVMPSSFGNVPPNPSAAHLGSHLVSLANEYEKTADKKYDTGSVEINMKQGESPLSGKASDIVVEVTLGQLGTHKFLSNEDISDSSLCSSSNTDETEEIIEDKKRIVKILNVSEQSEEKEVDAAWGNCQSTSASVEEKTCEEDETKHTIHIIEAIKLKPETNPLQVETFDKTACNVEKTVEDSVVVGSQCEETKTIVDKTGEIDLKVKTYEGAYPKMFSEDEEIGRVSDKAIVEDSPKCEDSTTAEKEKKCYEEKVEIVEVDKTHLTEMEKGAASPSEVYESKDMLKEDCGSEAETEIKILDVSGKNDKSYLQKSAEYTIFEDPSSSSSSKSQSSEEREKSGPYYKPSSGYINVQPQRERFLEENLQNQLDEIERIFGSKKFADISSEPSDESSSIAIDDLIFKKLFEKRKVKELETSVGFSEDRKDIGECVSLPDTKTYSGDTYNLKDFIDMAKIVKISEAIKSKFGCGDIRKGCEVADVELKPGETIVPEDVEKVETVTVIVKDTGEEEYGHGLQTHTSEEPHEIVIPVLPPGAQPVPCGQGNYHFTHAVYKILPHRPCCEGKCAKGEIASYKLPKEVCYSDEKDPHQRPKELLVIPCSKKPKAECETSESINEKHKKPCKPDLPPPPPEKPCKPDLPPPPPEKPCKPDLPPPPPENPCKEEPLKPIVIKKVEPEVCVAPPQEECLTGEVEEESHPYIPASCLWRDKGEESKPGEDYYTEETEQTEERPNILIPAPQISLPYKWKIAEERPDFIRPSDLLRRDDMKLPSFLHPKSHNTLLPRPYPAKSCSPQQPPCQRGWTHHNSKFMRPALRPRPVIQEYQGPPPVQSYPEESEEAESSCGSCPANIVKEVPLRPLRDRSNDVDEVAPCDPVSVVRVGQGLVKTTPKKLYEKTILHPPRPGRCPYCGAPEGRKHHPACPNNPANQ